MTKVVETLQDSVIDNTRVKLSKTLYFRVFLILTVLFTLAESIIVGFPANGDAFTLQLAILAVSSFLFLVHQVVTFVAARGDAIYQDIPTFELIFALFDGEVILELACLVFGWATIFENRGLAALRCVRVFRLMWYFELFPQDLEDGYNPNDHSFSLRRACQLCLLYLERLGIEITTAASRGAVVVLFMFFYISYLVAVVFWVEQSNLTTPEGRTCGTLNNCFITLLRLAFYDDNGFDFLQATMNAGYHGYTFLLILYTIGSAVILLNGLIGIFGDAFRAPQELEQEEEEYEKTGEEGAPGLVNGETVTANKQKDFAAVMRAISKMNARMDSFQRQLEACLNDDDGRQLKTIKSVSTAGTVNRLPSRPLFADDRIVKLKKEEPPHPPPFENEPVASESLASCLFCHLME